MLERAKLPRIRFHDLCHCHATLLLRQGAHPKVARERLGHAKAETLAPSAFHLMRPGGICPPIC